MPSRNSSIQRNSTMVRQDQSPAEGAPSWKDSDLQLFGSDLQTLVINSSATVSDSFSSVETSRDRFTIWRISKYRAVHWPIESYWHFYENDVFIILQTASIYASGTAPRHRIHLWVGKGASADDYGTGAYKVAELDEQLCFETVVYREVQGKESRLFRSYNNPITVWKGSAVESYFNNPRETQPARLLRWYRPDRRTSHIRVKEVPTTKRNLRSENVMIMDLGHQIYQWNGDDANAEDIQKATRYVQNLSANRGAEAKVEVLAESRARDHYFHFYLKDSHHSHGLESVVDSDDETADRVTKRMGTLKHFKPVLSIMHASGDNVEFRKYREGQVNLKDIISQNIAIFDTGETCFVWVGQSASIDETKVSQEYSHEYLKRSSHPYIPVTLVKSRPIDELEAAVAETGGQ